MSATYHVGTSGWVYAHWRGLFYPQGLAQARWLASLGEEVSAAYVYFNNDAEAAAVQGAHTLAAMLES